MLNEPIAKLEFLNGEYIRIYSLPACFQMTPNGELVLIQAQENSLFDIIDSQGNFSLMNKQAQIQIKREPNSSKLKHGDLVYLKVKQLAHGYDFFHFSYSEKTKFLKSCLNYKSPSIYVPKQKKVETPPSALRTRLVTENWYFEEREHLK